MDIFAFVMNEVGHLGACLRVKCTSACFCFGLVLFFDTGRGCLVQVGLELVILLLGLFPALCFCLFLRQCLVI